MGMVDEEAIAEKDESIHNNQENSMLNQEIEH